MAVRKVGFACHCQDREHWAEFRFLHQLAQRQQQQGGAAGAAGGVDLAVLHGTPQMEQIRQTLWTNSEALQAVVQELAHESPALAQGLVDNPEVLLGGGEDEEGKDGSVVPPGATVVHVTPEVLSECVVYLALLGVCR